MTPYWLKAPKPWKIGTLKPQNQTIHVSQWDTNGQPCPILRPTTSGESEVTTSNPVEPEHYSRFVIEPWDFCIKNRLDAGQSNVIKYVCRHDMKDGKRDLLKAKKYIEMLIDEYYPDA